MIWIFVIGLTFSTAFLARRDYQRQIEIRHIRAALGRGLSELRATNQDQDQHIDRLYNMVESGDRG